MGHKGLVSVCVLAYNRPKGLQRTLDLLTDQVYTNLEIIISDDCSSDEEVRRIAENASKNDSRVSYYRQEKNLGIIGNHAFVVGKATGEYIMWACDDDWWHPKFIASCVETLAANPELVLCTTNSAMVKDERFVALAEYIDTRGEADPFKRFCSVLPQIQWSNHAFYGVMRTSAVKATPFKWRLAFDLFFILDLALQGTFAQLRYYYFRKKIGGIGRLLSDNMAAIKVENPQTKLAPGVTFSLQVAKDYWCSSRGFWGKKLGRCWQVFTLARKVDPFPEERNAPIKALRKRPLQMHDYLSYLGSLRKTKDHDLTMALFEYGISNDEIVYDTERKQVELPLLGLTLKLPEQQDILKGYRDYLDVMHQYDVSFEQQADGQIIVSFRGVRFYLNASNVMFIFREIFLKKCYHVDVSKPSVVFDVGMNVGLSSIYFSEMDQVESVYSYELISATAQWASKNINLNEKARRKVTPFAFGLSNTHAEQEITFSKDYAGLNGVCQTNKGFTELASEERHTEKVQLKEAASVLRPLLEKHACQHKILKMDVEGSEYAILENLESNGLMEQFDAVMLEWHDQGPEQIEAYLRKNDFHILSMTDFHNTPMFNTGMIYAFKR